ncbi:hypothetical protein JRO89_XS03G0002900 [Xanthoceras sorbifolium]|uniref:TAZ-type domain-containing protein n=1 Tax=Xanthoceras sorbifolium TaxID=99658 RepID=A0ABQ8I7W0_9ROSI|nr:hypothetical protein JRO89_XS03G0002900 [Xanthoceras sorbifolium]
MASPDLESPWLSLSSVGESFGESFNIRMEKESTADIFPVLEAPTSSVSYKCNIPKPPPLPGKACTKFKYQKRLVDCSVVPKETKDIWDKLFKEAHGADVYIITEDVSCIPAHSSILSVASPVLGNILQQSKVKNGMRCIKIHGVPCEAVYEVDSGHGWLDCPVGEISWTVVLLRVVPSLLFYEEEDLKKFVLHLLVLSHCYLVPPLKRVCINYLEQGWLTKENVIDVLQLARSCDASRLSFICVLMVVKDFKSVSSTQGWKVMKRANPALEQELVEAVVEEDSRKQERLRKMEERKVYLQLHEAMEALLHICRDGCRTIGPHDKMLKESQAACNFPACKGLEALVRHFSNCKARVPGGCVHCKRMWQLLELHSRMCNQPDSCKVPLCRHFKEKMQLHSKKDEAKWKLLVVKVITAKKALGPFATRHAGFS